MEDLTILPLKTDKNSLKLKTPINPILPDLENNFVLLIFAPRGSGKTTLYSNLLLNPNFFKRENYQYAFIISSTIYQDLTAVALREHFKERFRHDNISCILSAQQSKSVQKIARLNATDVMVFSTKNFKEIEDIYTEYGMLFGSLEKWIQLFRYATKEPYCFLYMKIDKKPYRCFKNFTEDITNKFKETSTKRFFMGATLTNENENNLDDIPDKVENYKDELQNNN